VHPGNDSVLLTTTVLDQKGNYVVGLNNSAFTIYDNKTPQAISYFATGDEPVAIGVLIDLSGSMLELGGRPQLKTAADSVFRFLRLSHSENEYFLIGFTTRPQLLTDWIRGSDAFAGALKKVVPGTKEGLNTALYDACFLGIEKLRNSAYRKRAMLLISDGLDNESRYTFKELRDFIKESDVLLYSIGISPSDNFSGTTLGMEGYAVLNELSSITGGVAVFPEGNKKIEAAFEQIAIELRNQYSLGFRPAETSAERKWHKLKVKVTPPLNAPRNMTKLIVRSREGYYATKGSR
jgi:Ca-activated chloride channel family protein